jgi:transcription initiation factor IIF auxiliary subunit
MTTEPGEIEAPVFKFEFKQGLPLNWRHITNEIDILSLLSGQQIESLTSIFLNFAYADVIADPDIVCNDDPDVLKTINLM